MPDKDGKPFLSNLEPKHNIDVVTPAMMYDGTVGAQPYEKAFRRWDNKDMSIIGTSPRPDPYADMMATPAAVPKKAKK